MGIDVNRKRIAEFCRRWTIAELSLFGSMLRDDFHPESEVEVLVVFAPEADWGFRDLLQMEKELTEILGRKADLIEERLVEQNRNYIIRRHLLRSTEPVYERDAEQTRDIERIDAAADRLNAEMAEVLECQAPWPEEE